MARNFINKNFGKQQTTDDILAEDESSDDEIIDIEINSTDRQRTSAEIPEHDNNSRLPIFQQRIPLNTESIYESLDYDVCENSFWKDDRQNQKNYAAKKDFARWIVFIMIGIGTALIACLIDIIIEECSAFKYAFLKKSVDYNVVFGDLSIPLLFYIITNVIPVALGSILVTYVEPTAAGSGVPLVKCYLNGVKVPRIVRIKTLAVKVIGVATSVIGGLAGGKEGPMIHAGAVVAAGISQGKSTTFRTDFRFFQYFRDDHEKRDFVVGGASAGVAAAFGAPLGGVLFSLEEAASFWNQALIWRTLVASILSSFTLNVVLSAYHGLKSFSFPGLFNLGQFDPLTYEYFEIPIFVIMGVFGGLLGAFWNWSNIRLDKFRKKYIKSKIGKVLEAILVAALTATVACAMMILVNDCRPLGEDPTLYPVQLFCEDNQYNVAAALWFQTPEASVKSLFHDPPGSYQISTLLIFVAIYYPLSFITYGLSVSLGIFIPTLLVGAAWGHLTAMSLLRVFPHLTFIHPSKYALIGAAAQLGGVVRMTISLTVILIETTGNISFALPLMITLISAKWMGDCFNEGIYDTQIVVSKVPMLSWNVKKSFVHLNGSHIMNHPAVCIRIREQACFIVDILKRCTHNGFPVVDQVDDGDDRSNGRLRGIILRSQLIVILKKSLYEEKYRFWKNTVTSETFRNEYPRYPNINQIKLNSDKLNFTINSELFMNPSPCTVLTETSVPRIFQLFRAMGLRHLVVINLENRVMGMITRKDFI